MKSYIYILGPQGVNCKVHLPKIWPQQSDGDLATLVRTCSICSGDIIAFIMNAWETTSSLVNTAAVFFLI